MPRPDFLSRLVSMFWGLGLVTALIDRRTIVSRFNPTRNASSMVTPMQVGNGIFAFGADVTGLQTFLPYAIMSSWGWKNDTFPPGRTLEDMLNYSGVSLDNHGRTVQYEYGGVSDLQQWFISNPNRVNLGRIGLVFFSGDGKVANVQEADLVEKNQKLDLWTGTISSAFKFDGQAVLVTTSCAQDVDAISVTISSPLLKAGRLGLFLDFPWNDGSSKFQAPFVGSFGNASLHTTALKTTGTLPQGAKAVISHTMVNSTFVSTIGGSDFTITRDSPGTHRYSIQFKGSARTSGTASIAVAFGLTRPLIHPTPEHVQQSSSQTWEEYWTKGGFVDVLTGSSDPRASELQRRIVLSQYLLRVNEAGGYPPQESGLTNTGWYGKFHMEMYFWHSIHWALWNNWDLFQRSSSVYARFLSTSITRALGQEHWDAGARWSKMTDPVGRSAPGEINELLIWQQPHPLVFAEYEYRAFPTKATVDKWYDVVVQTANWMADFAWFNESSGVYDLGPPMYVVSEDTDPMITRNPAFELAYWNFGLGLAEQWVERSGQVPPKNWKIVRQNLARLPKENGTYKVFEDIQSDFWTTPGFTNDHPALVGLYGWLPQTPGVDLSLAAATAENVWDFWNITNCWGWDFPMLAMSAARNGRADRAIDWLLHPVFQFDDIGMPGGGARVPTPYFPGAGALLLAVAFMAEGWDGSVDASPGFPRDGWNVRAEGLNRAL